ncbi:MAG: response regulator [Candidatus Coatesbacteria bacterium]
MLNTKMRVLLVDGIEQDARIIGDMLTSPAGSPFEVVWAAGQADALSHIRTAEAPDAKRWDVVLLNLPRFDGSGADHLRSLVTAAPNVPVVLLTEHEDVPGGVRAFELGAQECLPRAHVSPAMLARTLRYACERAKSIEALARSEEQLILVQKLEAVGRLAGGIAHDFNNIMTTVIGYSELLLHRLPPEDPARKTIAEIHKAGQRATGLTQQLLAFSRRQMLQPKVLDLNAELGEIEELLRRTLGEDVEIRLHLAAGLGRLKVDPGRLHQVLLNLVVNARDAMPGGGTLTIETANVYLDEDYARRHVGVSIGPYVRLTVSDTGTGMDAGTLSHMFEPFFTTKEKGKGTGLGLSTVYGIVKQSGGNIWAYSEPGHGTTFKVYLPLVTEAGEPVAAALPPLPARGGTETILLVEDEQGVRDLAREVLAGLGYRVITGRDGEHALELAGAHADPIDLLLTDVVMPRMNGRILGERLEILRPGLRILYMSGYTEDAIIQHGLLVSGIAFLEKPFSPTGLAAKVREVLDAPPAAAPSVSV